MQNSTDKDTHKPIQGLKLIIYRAVYYEVFDDEDDDRKDFRIVISMLLSLIFTIPFMFLFKSFMLEYLFPWFEANSISDAISDMILYVGTFGPVTLISWLLTRYVIISDKFLERVLQCKEAVLEEKSVRRRYAIFVPIIKMGLAAIIVFFWAVPLLFLLIRDM